MSKKELICHLVEERAKGALVRLRIKNLNLLDSPFKYFFCLENKTKTQQQMLSLQSPDGGIVSEPKMIRKLVNYFFSSLLCAKKVCFACCKYFY